MKIKPLSIASCRRILEGDIAAGNGSYWGGWNGWNTVEGWKAQFDGVDSRVFEIYNDLPESTRKVRGSNLRLKIDAYVRMDVTANFLKGLLLVVRKRKKAAIVESGITRHIKLEKLDDNVAACQSEAETLRDLHYRAIKTLNGDVDFNTKPAKSINNVTFVVTPEQRGVKIVG
jgi:hypothetical protein